MYTSKDYEALQLFILETNRRFNLMGKTVMDFSDLIKKNRDAIDALSDKIEELQFEDEDTKRLVNEIKQDVEEIITDMESASKENRAIGELEEVLGDEDEGGIAQAVQQSGKSVLPIFKDTPPAPTRTQRLRPQQPPPSPAYGTQPQAPPPQQNPPAAKVPQPQQQKKPLDYENYKTDDTGFKYTREILIGMQWHGLRSLAINTYKCPESKVNREYYIGWILKKQRDQKIAGGN